MRNTLLIAAAIAASLSAGAQARADELQNQLLGAARATRADGYAFRRTLTIERTGVPRKIFVEQFDPRRAVGARWSLVTVDGRAPTPKELAQSAKARRGPVPSYLELADWIAAPATRSSGAPGYAVYRYARLPAGVLKINKHDASADTRAEVLVNLGGRAPFVERVRLTSTKGFRMMLVASVQSMTIDGRYRLLADGQPVPAGTVSDIAGSLMGKAGQLRTTASYSDFQKVR